MDENNNKKLLEETYRQKVDEIKWSTTIKKLEDFKKDVETCSEIDLFLWIDYLGYIIWKTEYDLSNGKFEYPEWEVTDKFYIQAELELAAYQTTRFGIPIFKDLSPTKEYWDWYTWWKIYLDTMPEKEMKKLLNKVKNGEDCSNYRPKGDWKL